MADSLISLEGKVALITGGSRGMGRACALLFADAGADSLVTSRNQADLDVVVKEIEAKGRRGLGVEMDVGNMDHCRQVMERVKAEFGRIDILVNNAAVVPYGLPSLIDTSEELYDQQMDVNLKGPLVLSQLAARMMREQGGGAIISLASTQAFRPAHPIYAISKAAIVMLSKVMAKEWGPYNIRANVIAPGGVDTKFIEASTSQPGGRERMGSNSPLGRIGQPEDIARVALFLASDLSGHVTGETILVDGGSSVGPPPVNN